MLITRMAAAVALLSVSQLASAQLQPQFYVGGNLGMAQWAVDDDLEREIASYGLSLSKHDVGGKVYLGVSLLPFLAIEGGYAYVGEVSVSDSYAKASLDGKGFFGDVVGMIPAGPSSELSFLARLGLFSGRSTYSLTDRRNSVTYSEDTDITGLKFGAGIDYKFSSQAAFRVEWERYRLKASDTSSSDSYQDVDLISVGLRYSF